jgi:Tol biopolymer transport system component
MHREHLKIFLGSAILFSASAVSSHALQFETSADPGGCLIEHVAADPDMEQFHYDGVSGDGKRLAVGWRRGETESGLYLFDLKTGKKKQIPGLNNGAVFAPDGKKLLNILPTKNGRTDIVEYDLATGEMTSIAPHDQWEWLASYSSDGSQILFNSYRTGASDIYTYRVSDGALRRWTNFDGYEAHGQFSPDDSQILFHRQEDSNDFQSATDFNLYVIDVASGEISQLTDEPSEEGYASWSPDGQTIVFSSDRDQESGEMDLYLMNVDGSGVRRLTDHPAKDSYPFFSPDGDYVYFHSERVPSGMYRMALDADLQCADASGE